MRKIMPSLTIAALLLACPIAVNADAGGKTASPAIADSARPAEDIARDAQRKPAELMTLAGVHEGAKIAELAPGGGYYTRLLSLAVGPEGHVFADSSRPVPAVGAWAADPPQVSAAV